MTFQRPQLHFILFTLLWDIYMRKEMRDYTFRCLFLFQDHLLLEENKTEQTQIKLDLVPASLPSHLWSVVGQFQYYLTQVCFCFPPSVPNNKSSIYIMVIIYKSHQLFWFLCCLFIPGCSHRLQIGTESHSPPAALVVHLETCRRNYL